MRCPTCAYEFDPSNGLECPRCGDTFDCSQLSCGECGACPSMVGGIRSMIEKVTEEPEVSTTDLDSAPE